MRRGRAPPLPPQNAPPFFNVASLLRPQQQQLQQRQQQQQSQQQQYPSITKNLAFCLLLTVVNRIDCPIPQQQQEDILKYITSRAKDGCLCSCVCVDHEL
jgi:hypothetical protein